jgi:2-haloacid dehalogenase
LRFTLISFGIAPDELVEMALLDAYRSLPAFPDTLPGLAKLRTGGHRLLAFSNGPAASVGAVLGHAGVLSHLDGIVSVDDLRTYKPNPAVYAYLVERGGRGPKQTWLVTANAWDAIGAKAAGVRVAWLQRNPAAIFDPWEDEFAPDVVVSTLRELPF